MEEKVERLLEQGKITQDEAEELLAALKESREKGKGLPNETEEWLELRRAASKFWKWLEVRRTLITFWKLRWRLSILFCVFFPLGLVMFVLYIVYGHPPLSPAIIYAQLFFTTISVFFILFNLRSPGLFPRQKPIIFPFAALVWFVSYLALGGYWWPRTGVWSIKALGILFLTPATALVYLDFRYSRWNYRRLLTLMALALFALSNYLVFR